MHRRDFGAWGAELSAVEFAKALAALGVLQSNSESWPRANGIEYLTAELNRAGVSGRQPVSWSMLGLPTAENHHPSTLARELTTAWERAAYAGEPVRIEVNRNWPLFLGFDPPSTLPWVAKQLSRPEVRASSVYIRVDEPPAEVGWQWPLRVGLLRDERSEDLRAALERLLAKRKWVARLATLVDAGGPDGACDLLLLPMDLRAALSLVTGLPRPPRADCTVVLGRTQGPADQWYRLTEAMRAAAETSGVAVAHVAAEKQPEWFVELVRMLSHNNPIDVALFGAPLEEGPFIAASRKLVEFSRLASQLVRMGGRFRTSAMASRTIDPESVPTADSMLEMEGIPHRLDEIGSRLEEIVARAESDPGFEGYLHESDLATAAAELAGAEGRVGAEPGPHPAPTEVRFIQAQVFDTPDSGATAGERAPRRRSWRAGAAHEIVMRIGVPETDWISAPPSAPFPAEQLPRDQDEHELTVVLTEPDLAEEPQVTSVILPRSGNSTECRFYLFVPETSQRVRARIIVLHRNRVLQTALLHGPVTAGDALEERGTIAVDIETVVRATLGDLGRRRGFDAAILLNHTEAGSPGVTVLADGGARAFSVSKGMENEIKWFDQRLSDLALDRSAYAEGLESPATVKLLRDFARHGELLYRHLLRSGIGEGGLARGERIQIVSAIPEARLPVELVYDRRAPKDNAPLCPRTAEALRNGYCGEDCPRGEAVRDVVCPLGFWGLSRVLERHSNESKQRRPELADSLAGKDFAFRVEPVEGRDKLEVLRGGAVAGSQRVEKTVAGGLMEICEQISAITRAPLEPIATWETWTENVKGKSPSLLVLIVHTDVVAPDDPMERMEIGMDSWLAVVELDDQHLHPDRSAPAPLVLLLGCETGAPSVDFGGFVGRCLEYGASIVVASGAKIHSVHAVPVAKGFVDALRDAVAGGGATFGEVMRTVRREMLARGLPMVLTLTAYGDADWRLVPRSP